MQLSITEKSKQDIVDLLYAQGLRASLSNIVAAAVVSVWLSNVTSITNISLWFAAAALLAIFRPILCSLHKRYYTIENSHLWVHAWVGLSSILAAMYSFAFIAFVPLDKPEYIMSVGMFVVALSSASVIGYGASKYAMLGPFIPLTLPTALYFGLYGGNVGILLACSTVVYTAAILSLSKTMTDAFKKSITLNHQHKDEIEKRKQIEKQLQDISRRDSLTGLFNRRYFDEMLEIEIGRAYRNHTPLCLLMFDIDCFKEYNDEYGHVAGDNCLIDVSNIVEKIAYRKGDLVARYGGEEFAIILPNIDLNGAVAFANKLQQAVQKKRIPHLSSKLTTLKCVTISVGVTNLTPFTKMQASQFIEAADSALYEAKRQGRNRVHHFENNGIGQDLI
ncbi:MAG: GGDEF domain-containing protein [Glaciecola sp.]